jgi:catechol 2,3-dioxygenase-like lactoylglutathione lyase family enzyme
MQAFLLDFGLHAIDRTQRSLYMRGAGTEPVVHITEADDGGAQQGVGLRVGSLEELEELGDSQEVPVNENSEPGGGHVVTVNDPDGFRIDVIYGRQEAARLPIREAFAANMGADRRRFSRQNNPLRPKLGPSTVLRLGHVILRVASVSRSHDWYARLFNFKTTDSIYADDPAIKMFELMHCGLGRQFTDHHTIGFMAHPVVGVDHSAFEVLDWDDLAIGHDYLLGKGHQHSLGIGRHVAGSQVFDYWRDPSGVKIEHWTDGDHINDDYKSAHMHYTEVPVSFWGSTVPTPEFIA